MMDISQPVKKPRISTKRALNKIRALHLSRTAPSWPRTVGERINDGSVYAGLSPETNRVMFAMPSDGAQLMSFNDAAQYAKKMNSRKALGHDDWRVPTKRELSELCKNKDKGALKGTFNMQSAQNPGWAGFYWSSTMTEDEARPWAQEFSTGREMSNIGNGALMSVRLVR